MIVCQDLRPQQQSEADPELDAPPTPARSALMGRVRGKNTTPEMVVRRAAHRLGLRFRIHRRDMPGTPDIVLRKHRLVIFVHGCFWHRHEGCRRCTTPKTRAEFWSEKFRRNVERDHRHVDALRKRGWNVLIVWECETKNPRELDVLLIEATTDRTS
ncbi:very short patch repair endonuclease [Mesorhizobium sanjuanii]|uniref:Very short patch repair endonuclease n=1 Tax=Mesorhizobium sanjuanii TaxID=2037900 RepID=A0A2A6F7B1_9HYPH|nr:very short patch repair endonuclease [Mesorhizobium sanjuanii]